jgi:FkbM family methyltransferase
LSEAYNLLSDRKSKDLFIAKLALMASNGNWKLFKEFMLPFSEPILEFGFSQRKDPQIYYYFNNDVFTVSNNEIYVDIGAFDGDTVETFVQACRKSSVDYRHVYAFEPDPRCYQQLLNNAKGYENISCYQLGLWSESKAMRFMSSDKSFISEAGGINESGDIEIQVVSLDEFLRGAEVTLIKMDPVGNVIPDVLKGATGTIREFRPKLAIGAYHSLESIFEIPLQVHKMCSDYKLYLRHNTYHLCDTDLLATI